MARHKSRTMTDVELEFMKVLWAEGELSTEQVQKALRGQGRLLADGSIRKVLSILVAKGYAARRAEGRGFLYRARVPAEQAKRGMLLDLAGRAFGGSAALMVAALLDAHSVRKGEMEKIKRLIAKHEGEGKS